MKAIRVAALAVALLLGGAALASAQGAAQGGQRGGRNMQMNGIELTEAQKAKLDDIQKKYQRRCLPSRADVKGGDRNDLMKKSMSLREKSGSRSERSSLPTSGGVGQERRGAEGAHGADAAPESSRTLTRCGCDVRRAGVTRPALLHHGRCRSHRRAAFRARCSFPAQLLRLLEISPPCAVSSSISTARDSITTRQDREARAGRSFFSTGSPRQATSGATSCRCSPPDTGWWCSICWATGAATHRRSAH